MLALTVVVLGVITFDRLSVDLLPNIIYPEVRVRVSDPGVPARIMEDQITRQLEEQLAITEDAIAIESSTEEGRASVNLSFPYGTDINIALRDASNRLDRAKRFLPTTIEPPIIFKRDPSQIPVLEFVVSSDQRDPVVLRDWADYEFSKWFLNLKGVAALEVGGAPLREIQVMVDQERLAALGLDFSDVTRALTEENMDRPGGRFSIAGREMTARTAARFRDLGDIASLPLASESDNQNESLHLRDVAQVQDHHEDDRLRIRLDGIPGVKLSVQKQPQANTVEVVDTVFSRLDWLREQQLIPADINLTATDDQSRFIRYSLRNAATAAISGAVLAMLVVYLFLGNVKRTLIVGSAIPLAILVTFALMGLGGMTLNIMTLGGLALGVGMLVDNTIVMMENITRHQHQGEGLLEAPVNAAQEVNSAIVAATSTNLAAVVPFLFIGGLYGLLFRDLILTISAAILASLFVALTLVPSYSSRIRSTAVSTFRKRVDTIVNRVAEVYSRFVQNKVLTRPWWPVVVLLPLLVLSGWWLYTTTSTPLPEMDDGRIYFSIHGDAGMQVDEMDAAISKIEDLVKAQPEVESVFTMSGGFVFGRTERFDSNYGSLRVQLISADQRALSSDDWRRSISKKVKQLKLAGIRVRILVRRVRGIRIGRGDEDLSLRVQGPELAELSEIGDGLVKLLTGIPGLSSLKHTYENNQEELIVRVDRERAADLGISTELIGKALRIALDGLVVSDFIEGDREYDIRLRLARAQIQSPDDLQSILVGQHHGQPVRLREVASVSIEPSPSQIKRDRQRRIVEISGNFAKDQSISAIQDEIDTRLAEFVVPDGYVLYDASGFKELKQGKQSSIVVALIAVFLVLVVMAVQYESLRNPIIIICSIPFALIGVALAIYVADIPVSMPVWLGVIMLAGIVVNNAIVLVEQIEIERETKPILSTAISHAARLRLRPILMTTFTTVFGMLPLAIGLGVGSELLQPLAVVIVGGLSFATLVTLLLIPAMYKLLQPQPRIGGTVSANDA